MRKKRLIDATDLVRRILVERDKVPLEVVPRYNFGVPEPSYYGQHLRAGIRKALREIETSPTVDAVEVVRCKDCAFMGENPIKPDIFKRCGIWCKPVNADGFCSYGKRKMDAEVEGC